MTEEIKKHFKYKHKKTGNIYEIVDIVIDATNSRVGQKMVLYKNNKKLYIREVEEFNEKFEVLSCCEPTASCLYLREQAIKRSLYSNILDMIDKLRELDNGSKVSEALQTEEGETVLTCIRFDVFRLMERDI